MASIYQRGKGQFYWISYSPSPGATRIQKSLKTKDRTVARFRKNELENQLAQGESPLPHKPKPLQQIKDEFLVRQKSSVSRNHYDNNRCYLDQYFDLIKPTKVTDFNDANIELFFSKKPNCSIYVKRAAIGVFKSFLNWCVSRNYIARNPIKIKKPGLKKNPHRFLSVKEIAALKKAAAKEALYPQIMAALYTGARKSELIRLQWKDVNLSNKRILIRAGKTDNFRHVPLQSAFGQYLRSYKRTAKGDLCFPGAVQDHWTNERRIIRRIKKGAKLQDVRRFWYTLRHTFGSHYYMNTGDLKGLSEILGHSDIRITAAVYIHLSPKHMDQNIQKIRY